MRFQRPTTCARERGGVMEDTTLGDLLDEMLQAGAELYEMTLGEDDVIDVAITGEAKRALECVCDRYDASRTIAEGLPSAELRVPGGLVDRVFGQALVAAFPYTGDSLGAEGRKVQRLGRALEDAINGIIRFLEDDLLPKISDQEDEIRRLDDDLSDAQGEVDGYAADFNHAESAVTRLEEELKTVRAELLAARETAL